MAVKDDVVEIYDGASWQTATSYRHRWVFMDNGTKSLDKVTFWFDRTIRNESWAPEYEDEVRLQVDSSYLFGGRVHRVDKEGGMWKVTAYSYGAEFLDVYVNEVYAEGTALEDVVEDLITNYTDLTWNTPSATGISLGGQLVLKDKRLSECIELIISKILDWTWRTDYQKNFYMEAKGTTSSGVTLTVGPSGNVVLLPTWTYNPDFVARKVIVEGGKQTFVQEDTFSPDGATTTFNLTKTPIGNVEVDIDGSVQDPKVEGASDGDYEVDAQNNQLIFDPAPSGTTGTARYEYNLPIRIEMQRGTGKPERKVENKAIKSFSEARKYAKKFLDLHEDPSKNTTLTTQLYDTSLRSGRTVRVIDNYEDIDEDLTISKLTYAYPDNTVKVKVGTYEDLLWDWQREVMERVRQLEQEDSSADIVQEYEVLQSDITVTLTPTVYMYEREVADTGFWGDGTAWGTAGDYWGDRREGDQFTGYDTASNYSFSTMWDAEWSTVDSTTGELMLNAGTGFAFETVFSERFIG